MLLGLFQVIQVGVVFIVGIIIIIIISRRCRERVRGRCSACGLLLLLAGVVVVVEYRRGPEAITEPVEEQFSCKGKQRRE